MSQNQREAEMGDSNDASSGKRKRTRKPMKDRSEVWDHFTKYVDAEGAQRARCNYCEKVYCSDTSTNGTSSLRNHLKACNKLPLSGESNIVLRELFEEYKKNCQPKTTQTNQQDQSSSNSLNKNLTTSSRTSALGARFMRQKMESGEVESKCELVIYLKESVHVTKSEDFDILKWWKVNPSRFPILSQLARDVLAIRISTVASESAFSTGGRVLDPYRTSLTPKVLEGLICAQSWLRSAKRPKTIKEYLSDLEKFEEAFSALTVEENVQDDAITLESDCSWCYISRHCFSGLNHALVSSAKEHPSYGEITESKLDPADSFSFPSSPIINDRKLSIPAAAAAEDDDVDVDLFGEETEEEKKAAEKRAAAVKASGKKK